MPSNRYVINYVSKTAGDQRKAATLFFGAADANATAFLAYLVAHVFAGGPDDWANVNSGSDVVQPTTEDMTGTKETLITATYADGTVSTFPIGGVVTDTTDDNVIGALKIVGNFIMQNGNNSLMTKIVKIDNVNYQ